GVPFVAPVVVDGTAENAAIVPTEFMRVQWTRLPGGLPTPQFVEQIKRLLGASGKVSTPARGESRSTTTASVAPAKTSLPLALKIIPGLVIVALVAYILFQPRTEKIPAAGPVAKSAVAASTPLAADNKSIAVLPFANLSSEKENEFFADGVHDDVITNLAKIRDLKVISRTSVLAYRDTAARNLKKIAAELGVANVLEGSVRRVGNQVRVTAQLINATTDEHLWAETYDGELTDIFGLQARLAREIAAALKATLTAGEKSLIERRPTQNQEAYDLYLRARAMHQEVGERGGLLDYPRIITVYEEAIAKDPKFALAYAQVATVHSIMHWFGHLDPTPRRGELMKAAVDAAVRLAPDAPETHLALGAYHYRVRFNWAAALAEFKLAEQGLPNDAQLSFWLAITHRRLGRWSESMAHFDRSVGLNPRDFAAVENSSNFLLNLRRWDQADRASTRFLAYFPGDVGLLTNLAFVQYERSGDYAALIRAVEALPPANLDASGIGQQVFAATLRGDLAEADRMLAEIKPTVSIGSGWYDSSVVGEPAVFVRAKLAFLRGDGAATRRHAAEATAYYRDRNWNTRQQPWVRMRLAQTAALAGQAEEAIREAEGAIADMTAHDLFAVTSIRPDLGEVYLVLGRKENALAVLRQMMNEPCALSPQAIRTHPLWSRLKDDPRFEQILKSAKTL
ncbi:MAG: hypothetical protein Q8J74_09345, partial [Candidatus Didemnitutus sp.]|nr:hypothetical protein [Candidatus Didemnitutus sp.]